VKVAVRSRSASRVTVQSPMPEHAPCQAEKLELALATAVSWTFAPAGIACLHGESHVKPRLLEPTVPDPLPPTWMVRTCVPSPPSEPPPLGAVLG
jgi:hypothetical protein